MKRSVPLAVLASLFAVVPAAAQADSAWAPARVGATAYARAAQFVVGNAEKLTSGIEVSPRWVDGGRFWYRNQVFGGHEFVLVDPAAGTRRPAFDHARLAAALTLADDTSYVPEHLPFDELELTDSGIRFWTAETERWECDTSAYRCTGPDSVRRATHEILSPDGDLAAFSREENLWVRDTATGEERQLSTDGTEDFGYGVTPEGCCQEITNRRRGFRPPPVLEWSPDGRRIATHRYDERDVARLHLLEAATGRPILHSYRYALPGDSVVPTWTMHVFDAETGTHVAADMEPAVGYFAGADTAWANVQWDAAGERVFFSVHSRDFRRQTLYEMDAATGDTRAVIEETGDTYVELNQITGLPPNWRVLDNGTEVLWFSERDGWGHLYLYDIATGSLKNRVTSGPWLVLEVLRVDEAARAVYFTAVGREEGRDPYYRHLYRASLDGGGVTLLTPEDADHDVRAEPGGRRFVDTWSTRDRPPVTLVRGPEGRPVMTVEEAEIDPLIGAGWRPPERFAVKGRDGRTDVYGFLFLPSDLEPGRLYPVVDYVYPGPQIGPIRSRGFTVGPRGQGHALAELGFITFVVDAIGTPYRSKAFHDGYYGDMGDNGLPDHIAALEALALEYPVDLERVGIFGHSGGGFASTDAILRHPDFFKVAVSGAGNHDNRGYHFPWGEKYQGLLEELEGGGDNYDSQANQNLAANLEGKLLLHYGTLDDNVHPNMTLLVAERLIEHNRDFDMLVFPNRNHGYAREPYLIRRTWDYFVKHLMGAEPPEGFELKIP